MNVGLDSYLDVRLALTLTLTLALALTLTLSREALLHELASAEHLGGVTVVEP